MEDKELIAMDSIIKTLAELDPDSKNRVLDYVFNRLNIQPQIIAGGLEGGRTKSMVDENVQNFTMETQLGKKKVVDIKTLKAEKNPASANQMVALVAYYLSEEAPLEQRKETINSKDIDDYFKQASFGLPGRRANDALINAKNAGYINKTSDVGEYKLNPVGYNLIVHGLPKGGAKRKNKRRTTKKTLKKNK